MPVWRCAILWSRLGNWFNLTKNKTKHLSVFFNSSSVHNTVYIMSKLVFQCNWVRGTAQGGGQQYLKYFLQMLSSYIHLPVFKVYGAVMNRKMLCVSLLPVVNPCREVVRWNMEQKCKLEVSGSFHSWTRLPLGFLVHRTLSNLHLHAYS